jgi:tRNA(adenine34) deaminase
MDINKYMQAAIETARNHKTPFGAVITKNGKIVVQAANQTRQLTDPTAHAEICAIRRACTLLQSTRLQGCSLITTCEPCPMCMSAAIWAGIETLVYGCSIPVISEFMYQIDLGSAQILKASGRNMDVQGHCMADKCRALLADFG